MPGRDARAERRTFPKWRASARPRRLRAEPRICICIRCICICICMLLCLAVPPGPALVEQAGWPSFRLARAEPVARASGGLQPLRGLRRLGKPAPAATSHATRQTSLSEVDGARLLFEAIGHIGNRELPRATAILFPFTTGGGIQAAGHRQEASYYLGVALARGGLPLLAGRYFAAALAGEDAPLARKALGSVQELTLAHPGVSSLLELPREGLGVALPPELHAAAELARANEALRRGESEQARALLAGIPRAGRAGLRARMLLSTLHPPAAAAREQLELLEQVLAALGPGELAERDPLLLHTARLAYNLRDPTRALPLFLQVGPQAAEHGEAQLGAASALLELGRPAEALQTLFQLAQQVAAPSAAGDGAAALPPGAGPLAARIYLEACAPGQAEALLETAVGSLEQRLQRLDRALADQRVLLALLDDGPEAAWRGLLLRPEDGWLPPLRRALAAEGRRLEHGQTPFARTPVHSSLVAEHRALEEELERRAATGLRRRAQREREATVAWLRMAHSLRYELLRRRQEAVRSWLAAGTGERPPARPGPEGWSFAPRWSDPALSTAGKLRFGGCPLGGGGEVKGRGQ